MKKHRVNLLIITPHRVGGLGSLVEAMQELCIEDFRLNCTVVDLSVRRANVLYTYINDLLVSIKLLLKGDFHVIMYLGGVPYLGGIIARLKRIPVVVFVNGYVIHETISYIRDALLELDVRRLIAGIIYLTFYRLGGFVADLFIFPCYGTLENNKIPRSKPKIVIPLWLSKTRLRCIEKIKCEIEERKDHQDLLVVAYLSNVKSPKVMSSDQLIRILDLIHKRSGNKIKVVLIDPKGELSIKKDFMLVYRHIPWEEFFKLLARSDLYIETILDDEFRYSTLEAMALGTPVVKITTLNYCRKVDLRYQLITCSLNEFLYKILDYINNKEKYIKDYKDVVTKYIYENRTWEIARRKLLPMLLELARKHEVRSRV
ncbi:MAG: hypothetical protein QXR17_07670 [Candidatus Bathyarchaeia archaeon]